MAQGRQSGLQRPVTPSKELAKITVLTIAPPPGRSKMWEYIKKNTLQNPENKREIVADDRCARFSTRTAVSMF